MDLIEKRILKALQLKAHSLSELVDAVEFSGEELGQALFNLKQTFLIEKHPVISGGCKTCACDVKHVYRLTYAGRQYLESEKES